MSQNKIIAADQHLHYNPIATKLRSFSRNRPHTHHARSSSTATPISSSALTPSKQPEVADSYPNQPLLTQFDYTTTICSCENNHSHQNQRLVNELLELNITNRVLMNKLLEKDEQLERARACAQLSKCLTERNRQIQTTDRRMLLGVAHPENNFGAPTQRNNKTSQRSLKHEQFRQILIRIKNKLQRIEQIGCFAPTLPQYASSQTQQIH